MGQWLAKGELTTLFFLHGMALGMWFVPLSRVLDAHGFGGIKPLAFAASALAAMVSPLIFGAMADRQAAPAKVLRGLALATAAAMALASTAIGQRWPAWAVLMLIQLHALCSAPTFSLSTTIVLSGLGDARREFGPVRAMATLGWMSGCWVVSALHADASTLSGYGGALTWLALAAFTFVLPRVASPRPVTRPTIRQRLGLDALALLRKRDNRVVYLTAGLFAIPLAAFYPYTPTHLRETGLEHTSAWMSAGQITEIIAMFSLAGLLSRWRLKWIIGLGLAFGVVRFGLCALDGRGWLLAGVALHGCSFTLVLITAQIYVDERVDREWRARAQALMSLMVSGVGNFTGYLSVGAWFAWCTQPGGTRWPLFWGVLALAVAAVMLFFLLTYRGVGTGLTKARQGGEAV